ncbi:NmrA domain-containing protein [Mycena venus]|uniref:NmrA domain-containing protein n=1 Tax=Mycena venus TaxID=2733690 RepID=A0A8H7CH47_9AGAR|nr:NmrA domain-containing protein [Mycena venus]
MSSSRIVAIFGATGVQGSAVVERLLKDGTFAPRAITRDLNSASSLKLKERGVEVVKGDMSEKASLVTALRGAEAVFAVTFPKLPLFGEDGPDEIIQGKNIVDAAKEVGIKFFVFSSVADSRKLSSKKIPPQDDKQVILEYLKSSGLSHAALLLGSFVENLWEHKTLEKTPTGFNIGIPKYDPTSLQAFTWIGRDLAASTLALLKSYTDPAKNVNGKSYPVITANMTYPNLAAMVSKALGVEVTYTKLETCGIPVLDDMFEIRSQHGGLFSETQVPNPDLVALGVKFSTMEEVMEVEVKKRFGQHTHPIPCLQSHLVSHGLPPEIPTPPPAEVVSLLTCNDVPEENEIPVVQEYIADLIRHLSLWKIVHIDSLPAASAEFIKEHDNETRSLQERNRGGGPIILIAPGHRSIDRMPSAVAQLIRERDHLVGIIREHKRILSPIRRLPAELIMKILRLVPPRTFGPTVNELEYPPWRLTRISSHWRACAVNDSSLWTKVSIHGDVYPRKFEEIFPLRMLEVQLALSKDASLDIRFDWCYFDGSHPHLLALLNTAVEHCSRWDRLVLQGDVNIPSYLSVLSRVKLQIPRLRRLEAYLSVRWYNPPGPDGVPVDCFAVAPSLREVFLDPPRLGSLKHTPPSCIPTIPWGQITRYRAVLDAAAHLAILRCAPGLRECGILFPRHLDDVPEQLIKLPALHRLHVEDSIFLNLISAAGVVELLINRDVDSVLTFLRRSGAQLTSLSIIAWEPSPDLIPLLHSCPTLTHLCLDVAPNLQNADTVIPVLHALGDTDLCPELASLFWRDKMEPNRTPDAFKDYEDALHEMIAARRRGKLASLRMFLQSAFPSESRVQKFLGPDYEGFDVRVSSEYEKPSFVDAVNPP